MKIFAVYFFILSLLAANFSLSGSAQSSKLAAQKKPNITASKNLTISLPSVAEQAVLDEINTARTEPQKYIKYLHDYRKLFKGNRVFLPNYLQVETNEGTAAVDEAIEFLRTISKLNPYKFSDGLNQAAGGQLKDLMANSSLGHRGKDGSDLGKRLARAGKLGRISGENISLYADEARSIVLMMIVDDGIKARSHRKNVFNPNFKVVGIAYGEGKIGEGLCVVDFADSFEKNLPPGVREF